VAVERAEVAVGDADVRVVDVAVHNERDLVRGRPPFARAGGRGAQRVQVGGLEQREGVPFVEALAGVGALDDREDGAVGCGRGHDRES
jgi:hypothetical protein